MDCRAGAFGRGNETSELLGECRLPASSEDKAFLVILLRGGWVTDRIDSAGASKIVLLLFTRLTGLRGARVGDFAGAEDWVLGDSSIVGARFRTNFLSRRAS